MGSGPDHWQTWLELSQKDFSRIHQKDWHKPNLKEWAEVIDNAISKVESDSAVLVAHSLGCLAVIEWVHRYNKKVKAALFVAPPDENLVSEKIDNKLLQESFVTKVPFRTILVTSENDPWVTVEKAEDYAEKWGSELVNIGEAGHINDLSGYGEWKECLVFLQKLSA